MRLPVWMAMGVAVLAGVGVALGSDRDSRMIDSLGVEAFSLDHGDMALLSLWGDMVGADPDRRWAIVGGLAIGNFYPDAENDFDDEDELLTWRAALGVKCYLLPSLTASVLGTYQWYDLDDDSTVAGGLLALKYRFMPAEEPVSPFIRATAALQQADNPPGATEAGVTDAFDAFVATVGAGFEFAMRDDMAFVFAFDYTDSQDLDDGFDYADGLMASVQMTYYWDR